MSLFREYTQRPPTITATRVGDLSQPGYLEQIRELIPEAEIVDGKIWMPMFPGSEYGTWASEGDWLSPAQASPPVVMSDELFRSLYYVPPTAS